MRNTWNRFRNKDEVKRDLDLLENDKRSEEYCEDFGGTRTHIMQLIGRLVEWAYDHGASPLGMLQQAYPQFIWSFTTLDYDNPDEKKIKKFVTHNDFLWHHQRILVTARSRRRKKHFISWGWISHLNRGDFSTEAIQKYAVGSIISQSE